jgi:thiosulfate reductase cytochrome b subunit
MEQSRLKKIYLYTRFERFWHWAQAVLIIMLLMTGFEIHGAWTVLGFEKSVELHNVMGIAWLVLFIFNVFWLMTTGEWKQYIPTTKKLIEVIFYYMIGIFKGKPHPVQKSRDAKHNPLQRLTYLGLAAALLPVQMISGLMYYTYNQWALPGLDSFLLQVVAFIHQSLAFLILSFLVVHVYMTTTGHMVFSHIAAMISGWEQVESAEVQEWETAHKKP